MKLFYNFIMTTLWRLLLYRSFKRNSKAELYCEREPPCVSVCLQCFQRAIASLTLILSHTHFQPLRGPTQHSQSHSHAQLHPHPPHTLAHVTQHTLTHARTHLPPPKHTKKKNAAQQWKEIEEEKIPAMLRFFTLQGRNEFVSP